MKVISVSMEALIEAFPQPACGANFTGGLGIRMGDDMSCFPELCDIVLVVPFYRYHWQTGEEIDYDKTVAEYLFDFEAETLGKTAKAMRVKQGRAEILGLWSPEFFNYLYVSDRWQRFQQEVAVGHFVPALLKKLGIKPDIIWPQEGHTGVVIPAAKEDAYFQNSKFLFTTHSPVPEARERFPIDWFGGLRIPREKYYDAFINKSEWSIDLNHGAIALSDAVTAVSEEHCEVTKRIYPHCGQKIKWIRNGSSRNFWLSSRIKQMEATNGGKCDSLKSWEAHQADKEEFLEFILKESGRQLSLKKPLLGFVRRFVVWKNQLPILEPIISAVCAERGELIDTCFGRLGGLGIQVFAAGKAHVSDDCCRGWIQVFNDWANRLLPGKFIFLEQYSWELRKKAAAACDAWGTFSWPEWEACGTSDLGAAFNDNLNFAPKHGGPKGYLVEFNPENCQGNGFFIDPYNPLTLYQKLKIFSDLHYAWIEKGDQRLLRARTNISEIWPLLDISRMAKEYELIFKGLINGGVG